MSVDTLPETSGRFLTRRRVLLAAGAAAVGAAAAGLPLVPWKKRRHYCHRHRLDALTPDRVERVRHDLETIRDVFADCQPELTADLGPPFADLPAPDLPLVFCTLLAHAMAPYGESSARDLPDLLTAPALHCGNYPVLMAHLYERLDPAGLPIALIGWQSHFVGAHDLAYRPHPDAGRCLFLDPTAALVVRAPFDDVAAGRRVDPDRIACFACREPEVPNALWMARAFAEGKFKPSELVYYFESLEHRLDRFGYHAEWPTPGAARQRADARTKRSPGT
jgi:hypothetical protein